MKDREILIAVGGGISAFKTAALVSSLAQQGARVTVMMSQAAKAFVGHTTFAALSGRPVADELFDPGEFPLGAHIELARRAELFCVAPATADLLGKFAHGLADELISTTFLCFQGPVLVAPAMNSEMWTKAAVQRNVRQLISDGVEIVEPTEGWLSCRQSGTGRMAEPATIAEAIARCLK
jgi:phosphopantothenoylcysteine decarboxylase